jgi:UDP:flavonoid glycosyltransferase YjiC (YdhE family)
LVVYDGGGTVPPALAIAQRLVARGHEVSTLGPATLHARFEQAGSRYSRYARVAEWDDSRGRAYEDQEAAFLDLLGGMNLAEDVLAEVAARQPDVVVVDCMLGGAICALERTHAATAAFVHVLYQPWVSAWGATYLSVGPTREALGLAPLRGEPPLALLEHVDAALLLTAAELDFPGEVAANCRYVGPVFDDDPSARDWRNPWPDGDDRPLVVVSMSTTYQHQERALAAVLAALADLPLRVLVTTGHHLRLDEVQAPPNATLLTWIPHRRALADAVLVVTHAGHGTVVAALAQGVPLLCLPLGRDQHFNAERVAALGAGEVLPADTDPAEIRLAVETLLSCTRHRQAAQAMARAIAGYGDGAQAIHELEALL